MRIHLAGQGPFTMECKLKEKTENVLATYAYPQEAENNAPLWNELMGIYLAGGHGPGTMECKLKENIEDVLVTYDRPEQTEKHTPLWNRTDLRPRVIIDSGAFTAWSTGKVIDPRDYAEWALDFDKRWRHKMASLRYINLDHIPGTKGISATPDQLKEAVIKSQKNADFLRASGLSPVIEVFHQDEPFELLKTLEDRRDGGCIAISPRNDVSVQKREAWLKKVLHYCVKTFGKDNIPPAHGLAVTSERLLRVFPFFSVDSSSWVSCLRYGGGKAAGLDKIPRYNESEAAMSATIHTLRSEIRKYKKMEADMTKLWKIRGIEYDESTIR